jgi:hypothetical protein
MAACCAAPVCPAPGSAPPAPAAAPGARWTQPGGPDGADAGRLVLYNSLADAKVPFVPAGGPGSRQVTWYGCGPTVYDSAHLGHARNYVTFDILRRVMEDYFGYNVLFVMNVTDVDDKIILRARRNFLLQRFRSAAGDAAQVRAAAGGVEGEAGGQGRAAGGACRGGSGSAGADASSGQRAAPGRGALTPCTYIPHALPPSTAHA